MTPQQQMTNVINVLCSSNTFPCTRGGDEINREEVHTFIIRSQGVARITKGSTTYRLGNKLPVNVGTLYQPSIALDKYFARLILPDYINIM